MEVCLQETTTGDDFETKKILRKKFCGKNFAKKFLQKMDAVDNENGRYSNMDFDYSKHCRYSKNGWR